VKQGLVSDNITNTVNDVAAYSRPESPQDEAAGWCRRWNEQEQLTSKCL
jgi:hypothetical protein